MFPPIPLTWAENANFAAGVDPWSGTPTKVAPTTQTRDEGFVPEEPLSAEQTNYLFHFFCKAVNIMATAIVSRFDARDVPSTVAAFTSFEYARPFWDVRRKRWIHPGSGSAGSGYWSRDLGMSWTDLAAGTGGVLNGGGANNDPASATFGDLLMGYRGGSANLRRFNHGAGTWGNVAHNNAAAGCTWMVHDDLNDTWIYFGTGAGNSIGVSNAPDSTYVFTSRTLAGTPTVAGALEIGKPVVSSTGICIVKTAAAELNVSTDGGTTWALAGTMPSAPAFECSYCWVPDRQEFVMAAADGGIYYSTDGDTWTLRAATTPPTTLGYAFYALEAFGSVIWGTYRHATLKGGMAFSLDGGETWQPCGPGGTDAAASVWAGLAVGETEVCVYGSLSSAGNARGIGFCTGLARVALGTTP